MLDRVERVITLASPPLVVTSDPLLAEQLQRLCAAAGVAPDMISVAAEARGRWRGAACVLVGDDLAGEVAALTLPRRGDVVLVTAGPETAATWQRGVALRADHVAVLPDSERWLVDRLTDWLDAGVATCLTLGCIGASGGAGASTLAAAVAMAASRRGVGTMLVDADPLGAGVELVLGCEDADGLRWPQVATTQGRVSSSALRSALPRAGDVSVLSWDRRGAVLVDAATMRSILSAARRGSELLIIDLPRRLDDAANAALTTCDVLVVVATGDVRAAASAGRLLALLRNQCPDVRLVLRSRTAGDLSAETLSKTLQLPLLATIPTRRAVERSIDAGFGPPSRGRLHRQCESILEELGLTGAGR